MTLTVISGGLGWLGGQGAFTCFGLVWFGLLFIEMVQLPWLLLVLLSFYLFGLVWFDLLYLGLACFWYATTHSFLYEAVY